MSVSDFGVTSDGQQVQMIEIEGGGLVARFLTYGAVLRDLRLDGHGPSLVLGLNTIEDYQNHSPYFGATAGRCANRIAGGSFEIDGQRFQTDQNFLGKHSLHGGANGIGKQVWRLLNHSADQVKMGIDLADGHMGFPGAMSITAQFSLLKGGVLDIVYAAKTDAPTLCNIAHHSYFNLTGKADLAGQILKVDAPAYLPVDAELIPTGQASPVKGSEYDFQQGRDLGAWPKDVLLDHNYCLSQSRGALCKVATLTAQDVQMTLKTTEPGLQVCGGAKINVAAPGLDGATYGPFSGVALEPQIWPDAANNAHFPSALLRPDETYEQRTQYIFATT